MLKGLGRGSIGSRYLLAVGVAMLVTLGSTPGSRGERTTGGYRASAQNSQRSFQGVSHRTRAFARGFSFESNTGQMPPEVRFAARGAGYAVFLTSNEMVLSLERKQKSARSRRAMPVALGRGDKEDERAVLRMGLIGSNPAPIVRGLKRLPATVNYFVGTDPRHWRVNVPTYTEVKYENVYPGVDLVFYGHQQQLEYDFIVAPGADPTMIVLSFDGADRVIVDESGNLVIQTSGGDVIQRAPSVYQSMDDGTRAIAGRYVLVGREHTGSGRATHRVRLEIGAYDATKPLIIDPLLEYSTYLGGSGIELPRGIAVDETGSVYVAGSTTSADFPTQHPVQPVLGGGYDAFVAKFTADGSTLVYATYLGGVGGDFASGVAVNMSGQAVMTGVTSSRNFPTTAGALQSAYGGGPYDGFLAKLTADGSALIFSTYLGGSRDDRGQGVAIDATGHALVTGFTESTDFPTANPLQPASGGGYDAFVSKVAPDGSAFSYSTYLGGSGFDLGQSIAISSDGRAFATGYTSASDFPIASALQPVHGGGVWDGFVASLTPDGSALSYSTYLGGSEDDFSRGIAVTAAGEAVLTGGTHSLDFPTVNAVQPAHGGGICDEIFLTPCLDVFVTKLNPTGSALVYSTYLGGIDEDFGSGIGVDPGGQAVVTGRTWSIDFPTATPFQSQLDGQSDAFVANLKADGSVLVYSTYLGGSGEENPFEEGRVAVDAESAAYVTGLTMSHNFPTSAGAFDGTCGTDGACNEEEVCDETGCIVVRRPDAFVLKIRER